MKQCNMITQLLLWMIMAYGMTNIIVYGSIFNGPRNSINKASNTPNFPFRGFFIFLSDMIKCMMCASVWIGFFFGIFLYSPVHEMLGFPSWGSWFFDGMLSSGFVWAFNGMVEWFEENRPTKN
jgi:hypothetical protein